MTTMKILLLGKNGQVGWELQRSLAPLGELVACDFDSPAPLRADFSNPASLSALVQSVRPDVIVNAAAHTAVDKAESEPELAQAINAEAPAVLAREAADLGALLVHYSTDYVFDGSGEWPRDESAPTGPLSVYGRTKLAAEQAIAASGCRHLILRTSWVYGLHGANFMKTMLRLGRERDELRVVGDQIGAPTWTRHLADVSALILARREVPDGLYHLAAAGETSWHGYAEAIFKEARRTGLLDKSPVVRRITSAEFPLPAARPANSRLDCSRFQRDFGLALPDWRSGLVDCLADARF